MPSSRVTLIHNPDAGDDRQPSAGQLKALLKEAGYRVRYQSTQEKGWQKILKRATDIVAVAGGDGTVGKVAKRLIGRSVPIGVLPMGTANNISKTLGIVDMTVTQLIPSWKTARRLAFDAGIARGPWGERYFIEGAGIGLLTSAMPKASASRKLARLKDAQGKVSYAQQLFREHLTRAIALDIEATLDGKDISGRYLLLEALNISYIGPNLFLAPGVARNNGEFEVVLIPAKHRSRLRSHIKRWQDGEEVAPSLKTRRGKKLVIQWTGFGLHFDDKVWPDSSGGQDTTPALIEFEVVPEATTFLVPAAVQKIADAAKKRGKKRGRKKRT